MNARQDSTYRLSLARRYLEEAEQDLDLQRWRSTVESAQLAIENAAKAVVACFGPVPRSHDLDDSLRRVVEADLPQSLAEQVGAMLPTVVRYGTALHIRATYGDEQTFRTPWELFDEGDARRAVEAARECLATAEAIHTHFFPPPDEGASDQA